MEYAFASTCDLAGGDGAGFCPSRTHAQRHGRLEKDAPLFVADNPRQPHYCSVSLQTFLPAIRPVSTYVVFLLVNPHVRIFSIRQTFLVFLPSCSQGQGEAPVRITIDYSYFTTRFTTTMRHWIWADENGNPSQNQAKMALGPMTSWKNQDRTFGLPFSPPFFPRLYIYKPVFESLLLSFIPAVFAIYSYHRLINRSNSSQTSRSLHKSALSHQYVTFSSSNIVRGS